MIKKDTKTQPQSKLSTWLFGRPARFSLTLIGCSLLAGILYSIIAAIISPDTVNNSIAPLPMTMLIFIVGLFSAYRLIKKLPHTSMDRHSFISTCNGAFFVTCVAIVLNVIVMTKLVMPALIAMNAMSNSVAILGLFGMILMALISAYMCGLAITMLYATYLRARSMGVSRARAILSIPFSMFLLAGYLLPEKPTKHTAIATRTKFYDAFTTWASNNKLVSWVACALILAAFGLIFGFTYAGALMLFIMPIPFIIFGVWYIMRGGDAIRKNIDGKFSTVAVIVNILMIVLTLGLGSLQIATTAMPTSAAPAMEFELTE